MREWLGVTTATAGRRPGRRRGKGEGWLPFIYFFGALAVVVAILPSALRPPQQPPNQSAEFSPNAPPDDQNESIVGALGRAGSGVAGGLTSAGSGPGAAVDAVTTTTTAPPRRAPRACPSGAGNPPRQVFSLYAAPCATSFEGDNGGATAKGVTATEVRVALAQCTTAIQASYKGDTPNDVQPSETAADRTYRVLQQFFNRNFQFYGRHLTFVQDKPDNCFDPTTTRATAVDADLTYHAFGLNTAQRDGIDEGARRKLVVGDVYGATTAYFASNQPYMFSWQPDGTQTTSFISEFLCKQLVGKNADFTDDALIGGKPRKFGMLFARQFFLGMTEESLQADFKSHCGQQYDKVIGYTYYAGDGAEELSNSMVQMRAANVTTIVCVCDYLSPSVITNAASSQEYYPEWVMPGTGDMDQNVLAATFADTQQWKHAIGFSYAEMAQPLESMDFYRAYKSIDPAGTPDTNTGRFMFMPLLMWANGIQQAGPDLTPETFTRGLQKMPRRPPDPVWSVAGGFGPGDFTYADYIAFVWWDQAATPPDNPGASGAWRYLNGGQRYKAGELPTEPLAFQKEGAASAPPH